MKQKDKVLQQLYVDHADELFRFCKFKSGDTQDAEDCVSEAFVRLYENDSIESIDNKRAWLFKVARNVMYDSMRKNSKNDNIGDGESDDLNLSRETFENTVVNEATVEYLEDKLHNLDDDTADIIIMRIWDDLSFSDISTAVDLSVDAVKKRFYRGIEFLKSSVSREEKSLNIKSISIPFILAGILGISTQPAYAFTAANSATIASAVGSTLGFTFSNMINSNLTSSAATAGTGLLATTAAKLIAGSAIVIAGAGVGIGAVAIQYNEPEPQEQNEIVDNNDQLSDDKLEVPTNWTYIYSEKCEINMPTPPTNLDTRAFVAEGFPDGKFVWDSGVEEASDYSFTVNGGESIHSYNIAADSDGNVIGAGWNKGVGVSIECNDNENNWTLDQFVSYFKDALLNDSMYDLEATPGAALVVKTERYSEFANISAYYIELEGGVFGPRNPNYLFVNNGMFYVASVSKSVDIEDQNVREHVQIILDNIKIINENTSATRNIIKTLNFIGGDGSPYSEWDVTVSVNIPKDAEVTESYGLEVKGESFTLRFTSPPDGASTVYSDENYETRLPEYLKIETQFLGEVFRVRDNSQPNSYLYTSDFGVGEEACPEWKSIYTILGCSGPRIRKDGKSVLAICEVVNQDGLAKCDEIIKSSNLN